MRKHAAIVALAALLAATALPFAAPATDNPAASAAADNCTNAPGQAGNPCAKTVASLLAAGGAAAGANDYAGAEDDYRSALDLEIKMFGANAMPIGDTLAELALQVSNQARFEEADALFRRAQDIVERSNDVVARNRLTSYLALNAANQRKFADALVFAREATAQYRAQINDAEALAANNGPPVPVALRAELAHCLRIEAEMAVRLDDTATARAATDEVIRIVSETPQLPLWWRPDALALTAEVSEHEGQVVSAEKNYRAAIALDKKLFGDGTPTALAELKLGGFYSRQQVYDSAIATYHDALAILEKNPPAAEVLQPDEVAPLLDAAIAQPGAATNRDAFHAVQLAQSGVLDAIIAHMAARKAASDPALADLLAKSDAAQRKRDSARMDIAVEYARPADEQDPKRLDLLSAALKQASAEADARKDEIAKRYPDYAKLASAGPADPDDIAHVLQADQGFVTFLAASSESFAIAVTHDGLTIRRLTIGRDEMGQEVDALRGAFVRHLPTVSDFSTKTSYALYRNILGPLEPQLAKVHSLIVAPNSELSALPFGLLVTAEPPAGGEHAYAKTAWLVRRVAISEVPSPRAFLLLHQQAQAKATAAQDSFLGFGDPVMGGAQAAVASPCGEGTSTTADLLKSLPALPDTRHEVETVAHSFGAPASDVLLGPQANKSALASRPLDQFGVIYFATHGLLPSELACGGEPGLVLSPASGAASPVLYADEIATLHLNADLVVLSACNTAAEGGKRFGGGSLEGLADSFFDAGARAVLASNWSVPSAETATLMVDVFRSAKGQTRYAEALRQAQLAMIANPKTAHPYYWAAFTLMGLDERSH
jgi:CHAT domain-containing protein